MNLYIDCFYREGNAINKSIQHIYMYVLHRSTIGIRSIYLIEYYLCNPRDLEMIRTVDEIAGRRETFLTILISSLYIIARHHFAHGEININIILAPIKFYRRVEVLKEIKWHNSSIIWFLANNLFSDCFCY